MNEEILEIIQWFGGQSAMAKAIDVSQPAISQWARNETKPSPQAAMRIEIESGGRFRVESIRPDMAEFAAMLRGNPRAAGDGEAA